MAAELCDAPPRYKEALGHPTVLPSEDFVGGTTYLNFIVNGPPTGVSALISMGLRGL